MEKTEKRWTASVACQILDAADGARSDRAYATEQGIALGRIGWWRSRLRRPRRPPGAKSAAAKLAFVEVTSALPAESTTVEVLLTNGRQFRVSDRINAAVVGRLADALEKPC